MNIIIKFITKGTTRINYPPPNFAFSHIPLLHIILTHSFATERSSIEQTEFVVISIAQILREISVNFLICSRFRAKSLDQTRCLEQRERERELRVCREWRHSGMPSMNLCAILIASQYYSPQVGTQRRPMRRNRFPSGETREE